MASLSSRQALKARCPGGWFPTLGFALAAHARALSRFGGLKGVRSEEQLLSVLNAVLDDDIHRTLFDKATALGYGVATTHPFSDGNKRTALILTEAALEWNGYKLRQLNQDAKTVLFSLTGAGYLSREGLRHALLLGCGIDPLRYLEHETNPGASSR
jgi:death-on-curing protein